MPGSTSFPDNDASQPPISGSLETTAHTATSHGAENLAVSALAVPLVVEGAARHWPPGSVDRDTGMETTSLAAKRLGVKFRASLGVLLVRYLLFVAQWLYHISN